MTANNDIALPATLVIRDVRAMRVTLQEAVSAGNCRFDAGHLTQIDTAGLQLLAATVAALRAKGLQPVWNHVQIELADAAAHTDLVDALGLRAAA